MKIITNKTKLTEREAWVEIRNQFHKYAEHKALQPLTKRGICYAIYELGEYGTERITHTIQCRMFHRLWERKPRFANAGAYYFPVDVEHAMDRVRLIDRILNSMKRKAKK